ncbi:MAG: hypothetical protein HY781_00595 [Chloroflexi bacterium]|nr:hypothetical protein [Chloroflexota bacterium]
MDSTSASRWAWTLSLCTALLWIILGVFSLILAAQAGTPIPFVQWFVAALMFGNAAVLIWIGWGLKKQRRVFYYLALIYLAFNILLTITDDFGIPDLLYLFFVGAMLFALLLSKNKFLHK